MATITIAAMPAKATPAGADLLEIADSAAANAAKNIRLDSLPIAAAQVNSGVLAIARLATGTPNGTKFVRDDGTLAVPAGGSAQSLTFAGEFDPMDYGAAGTGLVDDTTAFNAAVAAIPAGKSGVIRLRPDKKYAINGTINRGGVTVRGGAFDSRGATSSVLVPWATASPVLTLGAAGNGATVYAGVNLEHIIFDAAGPNGAGTVGVSWLNGMINQQHRGLVFRAFTTQAIKMANTTAGTITMIRFDGVMIEGPATGSAVAGGAQVDITFVTGGAGYLTAIYFDFLHIAGNPWTNAHYCFRADTAIVSLAQTYFDMAHQRGVKLAMTGTQAPYLVCTDVQFDSSTSTDVLVEVYDNPSLLSVNAYVKGVFHLDGLLRNAAASATLDCTGMDYGNNGYGNMIDSASIIRHLNFSSDGAPATATYIYGDAGGLNLVGNPGIVLAPTGGGAVSAYLGGSANPSFKVVNDNGNYQLALVYPASGDNYLDVQKGGTSFLKLSPTRGLLYANSAAGSAIANTTTETVLFAGYTVAASELRAGQALHLATRGVLAATATPTLTLRVKYGASVLAVSPAIALVATAAASFDIEVDIVVTAVGASATAEVYGLVKVPGASAAAAKVTYEVVSTIAPTAFSSSASGALTVTAQWNTASPSNTLTARTMTIVSLN